MMFDTITRFIVPPDIAAETDVRLRAAGQQGLECFVLWTGVCDGNTFVVRTLHVPEQMAYKLSTGLCVRVEGDALHRLNMWLYEHGEQLAVQVHAHPTDAFHSDTDDTYPIVTVRGGLSIVVPDFAEHGVRGPGVASFRLGAQGWDELDPDVADRLISFEDGDGVR
jgi:hypothetical protein